MKSVDLFVGAGGLALGTTQAGFHDKIVVEWDQHACDTIRKNGPANLGLAKCWNLIQSDVRKINYSDFGENIDLLSGGPPCQPFSLGGKHRGNNDARDMFPEMVRAARELTPKVILIENVKGLLRRSFAEYFEYILLQLSYPELARKDGEKWHDHLYRLETHHTRGQTQGLKYNVVFRLLDAADYGVPQRRHRVFIVGFRSDLGVEWGFPDPTHSKKALLRDQWITGEYWERHKVPKRGRPAPPPTMAIKEIGQQTLFESEVKPWCTVRDAISDLPDPRNNGKKASVPNHEYRQGARAYPGHTGSPLDEPAKTLKAGDHGVPGGENMLAHPDGWVRYFTVREAARLQTFPDEFIFQGSWTETMRQLGNAVPVKLAEAIATDIYTHLRKRGRRTA